MRVREGVACASGGRDQNIAPKVTNRIMEIVGATPFSCKPEEKTMSYTAERSDYYTHAAHNMEQHGGHFAAALARAYYAADSWNRARLVEAFEHIFDDYAPADMSN